MLAWLPHYQEQIHNALHTLFTTRYTSNTEVEKLYEEAIAYAVE